MDKAYLHFQEGEFPYQMLVYPVMEMTQVSADE